MIIVLQIELSFLSDNTSVEWAFHYNSDKVVVGTTHDSESTGNWKKFGLTTRPIFSIHSHPNISPNAYDEYFSMGMVPTDASNKSFNPIIGFDWFNMQNKPEELAKTYLVYFPQSRNFYRLGFPNKITVK